MYAKVNTCVLEGLNGRIVDVEADLAKGMSAFQIVGLPDTAIREARERVRSAIQNSGFRFPIERITINLAPAQIRKEGSQIDLAIATGILTASGNILEEPKSNMAFLGELSLDGRILPVPGVLPMLISLQELGITECIIPKGNEEEASMVKGIKSFAIHTLEELVDFLNDEKTVEPVDFVDDSFQEEGRNFTIDFKDMKGQEALKRALEIAAAGEHNLLMIGPPGSGKTMAAIRLPTILPSLTFQESLESTKIYSAAENLKENSLVKRRPFRNPHHTSSGVSLIGGGRIPKPGEISLAHNGALFLDELPEFPKSTIELLRQPLEEKEVTISRANASLTYPSNFLFICGMNPCPCGYYGDPYHECTCSMNQINNYLNKVSRPILDRIDLHIEVQPVKIEDLQDQEVKEGSKEIRERVEKAREIQRKRFEGKNITTNGQMKHKDIEEFVPLSSESESLLKKAFDKYKFSARTYHKILTIARTIADLQASENVETPHLLEAIRYRNAVQKYWGS